MLAAEEARVEIMAKKGNKKPSHAKSGPSVAMIMNLKTAGISYDVAFIGFRRVQTDVNKKWTTFKEYVTCICDNVKMDRPAKININEFLVVPQYDQLVIIKAIDKQSYCILLKLSFREVHNMSPRISLLQKLQQF